MKTQKPNDKSFRGRDLKANSFIGNKGNNN